LYHEKQFGKHFGHSDAIAGNTSENDRDQTHGLVNKKGARTVLVLAVVN
jgi:hypothetical protein